MKGYFKSMWRPNLLSAFTQLGGWHTYILTQQEFRFLEMFLDCRTLGTMGINELQRTSQLTKNLHRVENCERVLSLLRRVREKATQRKQRRSLMTVTPESHSETVQLQLTR